MNKEDLASVLFEKIDDYAECKELAEEILDMIQEDLELDANINNENELMQCFKKNTKTSYVRFHVAKGRKAVYEEIKNRLEYYKDD